MRIKENKTTKNRIHLQLLKTTIKQNLATKNNLKLQQQSLPYFSRQIIKAFVKQIFHNEKVEQIKRKRFHASEGNRTKLKVNKE